jgi:hypothetical protein
MSGAAACLYVWSERSGASTSVPSIENVWSRGTLFSIAIAAVLSTIKQSGLNRKLLTVMV